MLDLVLVLDVCLRLPQFPFPFVGQGQIDGVVGVLSLRLVQGDVQLVLGIGLDIQVQCVVLDRGVSSED